MRKIAFLLLLTTATVGALGQKDIAGKIAPGMVDTGEYSKPTPWTITWIEAGHTRAEPDLLIIDHGGTTAMEIRTPERQITSVARNSARVGYLYAGWMAKKLHGKGTILVVLGHPDKELLRGIDQALAETPGLVLAAGWDVPPITADDHNGWLRLADEHRLEFLSISRGSALALSTLDLVMRILRGFLW